MFSLLVYRSEITREINIFPNLLNVKTAFLNHRYWGKDCVVDQLDIALTFLIRSTCKFYEGQRKYIKFMGRFPYIVLQPPNP